MIPMILCVLAYDIYAYHTVHFILHAALSHWESFSSSEVVVLRLLHTDSILHQES